PHLAVEGGGPPNVRGFRKVLGRGSRGILPPAAVHRLRADERLHDRPEAFPVLERGRLPATELLVSGLLIELVLDLPLLFHRQNGRTRQHDPTSLPEPWVQVTGGYAQRHRPRAGSCPDDRVYGSHDTHAGPGVSKKNNSPP